MDICRWNVLNASETISFRWIIVVMIYMATIVLCLSSDSFDERTHLESSSEHNSSPININEMVCNAVFYSWYVKICINCFLQYFHCSNPRQKIIQERVHVLSIWSPLSLAKSIAAIVGWILIGLRPTEDNLYEQLIEMEKYRVHGNWYNPQHVTMN